MRLSVLVTHWQKLSQLLARPLRKAVVMGFAGARAERMPQPWPTNAMQLWPAWPKAERNFRQQLPSS
jgi:hypothetical protein